MKQMYKRGSLILLALAAALSLTACSQVGGLVQDITGGGEDQAVTTLVRGNIDEIYLGKYDAEYLELVGSTEAEAEQAYLDGLEVEAEFFANYWGIVDSSLGESYADLDETLQADIIALYKDIYSHSKYEVKQAVRQEDGSYTVQVLVDPIDVMQKASDLYDNDGYEPLNAFWTKMNQMDPASVTDTVYAELTNEYGSIIVQMVREQLDSLGYLEQKSLSIQVQEDSDGYLSINQDDWGIFDSYVIAYP